MNIGWPEGIYLALNALFFLAALIAGEDGAKAGCGMFVWLFVTLPLLYWGGFFA